MRRDVSKDGEGEAVVVQSSTPASQVGDGVRNDPTAPFTLGVKNIRLVRIKTQAECQTKEEKDLSKKMRLLANETIVKHHSYVKSIVTVGRRCDYLIYLGDIVIGVIGGNSPPMPMSKPLQDYFEKITGTKRLGPISHEIVNNWKFTLTDDAPKNSGSRVLSIFSKLIVRDWSAKPCQADGIYYTPRWLITFVGAGKEGVIYEASGWKYIGNTANTWHGGFSKLAYVGKDKPMTGKKKIFVRNL